MQSLQESDALSDVFEQVEVRGLMAGGFAVRGPWVSRGRVTRPFKLAALVAGSARLSVDGPEARTARSISARATWSS